MSSQVSITRKGRWVVIDDQGNEVSQHNTNIEASENTANWSLSNSGKKAEIKPPVYQIVSDVEVVNPNPDPDPPVSDDRFTQIGLSTDPFIKRCWEIVINA